MVYVWSNDRQIREFIPCLNPEGEALYDRIESVFIQVLVTYLL